MCIFCGGQCGGVGDFLISLALPSSTLIYFKLKAKLAREKNRFPDKEDAAASVPPEAVKGELLWKKDRNW